MAIGHSHGGAGVRRSRIRKPLIPDLQPSAPKTASGNDVH